MSSYVCFWFVVFLALRVQLDKQWDVFRERLRYRDVYWDTSTGRKWHWNSHMHELRGHDGPMMSHFAPIACLTASFNTAHL
jgi:hypothetical protein